MELWTTLKDSRLKANLSQDEVAEKLNVTRQTISNWENNKFYPDILYVIELSDLYNLSLDELVKGNKNMIEHIKENVDIVKSKEKLSKRILICIYLGIWALSILTFWLFTGEQDGIGYSLMVLYCIIPITTFILSFIIGKDKSWDFARYFMPIFFGVMYMLVEYATFSLANMTSFSKFNLPEFSMIVSGAVISYIGILFVLVANRIKNKKGVKNESKK